MVFDKTGTLTKGKLSIAKVNNYSKLPENEIIKIVSSIEAKSEHPIAKGVVMYAKEKGISLENVTDFKNIVGYGVSAKYEEKNYFVGNEKLLRENNILPKSDDEKKMQDDGNSILYLADDKEVLALIGVKDVIKENAKEVINKLNKKNINVVMLTGDNLRTAKVIAKSLNIDKVIANVLPKSKAQEIEKLKNDGLVMMCGDGINDSISLVKADIGVSVESGTDIAMDSSDVVLMKDDLTKINSLIEISQKTVRNIKQNLFWAFFYNICMLPVAVGLFTPFGITINPMMAALAMTISSVTVTLNSLRLKRIIKNV